MDRDELREKIKAIIIEAREEDHHGNLLMYSDEATDSILSLIDAQRCVWVWNDDDAMAQTGCGEELYYTHDITLDREYAPFCPCCGRKVEVKDA